MSAGALASSRPRLSLAVGEVERHRPRPALSRLARPVPVAARHVEHAQPAQVPVPVLVPALAEPAQQRAGLAVAAHVHLMPGEGDRVSNLHDRQIY